MTVNGTNGEVLYLFSARVQKVETFDNYKYCALNVGHSENIMLMLINSRFFMSHSLWK